MIPNFEIWQVFTPTVKRWAKLSNWAVNTQLPAVSRYISFLFMIGYTREISQSTRNKTTVVVPVHHISVLIGNLSSRGFNDLSQPSFAWSWFRFMIFLWLFLRTVWSGADFLEGASDIKGLAPYLFSISHTRIFDIRYRLLGNTRIIPHSNPNQG